VLITPADHVISPESDFSNYILSWVSSAQQWAIVIFGVSPTKPETWYGYIKSNTWWLISAVEEFAEKPDIEIAKKYLASWQYLWNTGIFMFTIKTIKKAFATYCPWLFQMMQAPYPMFLEWFNALESISFDYAVMEKASDVLVCPMHLMWSDIWSRDAIDELLIQHEALNTNPFLVRDNQNNLIFSQKKCIVNGISDSFIITSEAWTYAAKKWNSQALKMMI
jgi:mannose-1-phosphate guanylyltransferase/mannose-6-phosphate isomerase